MVFAKNSGVKCTNRSKRRLELDGVKLLYQTNFQMKQETIRWLARGELDSSTPIVPITLDITKIDKGGNLVKGKLRTLGSTYSMQKIMDRLLQAGYLRDLFSENRNITDIKNSWERKVSTKQGTTIFTA